MDLLNRLLSLRHRPRLFPSPPHSLLRYMFPSFLLCLYLLLTPTVAHTVAWLKNTHSDSNGTDGNETHSRGAAAGSWLWQWAWAADGTVSIVDRTPSITFPARPASFGLELIDPLLGYVIPLSEFTSPCTPQLNLSSTSSSNLNWYSLSAFRIPMWTWGSEPLYGADPVLGCPDLCITGPHQPDRDEKWIALVQRGGCPFVEKARTAQNLGASAVVVGGDQDNPDALLNMYSERDASDIHIAATYIKYWDYLQLRSLVSTSNTTHNGLRTLSLVITTEYSAWEWYSPIITFIVILLLPTVLTFITLLIHRVRAARAAQRDRAPEEFVHRLPWRVWTGHGWEKPPGEGEGEGEILHPISLPEPREENRRNVRPADPDVDLERGEGGCSRPLQIDDDEDEHTPEHEQGGDGGEGEGEGEDEPEDEPEWVEHQLECAICLEVFAKGDKVRVLPCGHMFHLEEIDEWLIHKKKLCPVCKADVTQPHPLHRNHTHLPPTHPHHPNNYPPSSPILAPHAQQDAPSPAPSIHREASLVPSPSSGASSSLATVPSHHDPEFEPTESTPLLPQSSRAQSQRSSVS